jgi:hypothetical protein
MLAVSPKPATKEVTRIIFSNCPTARRGQPIITTSMWGIGDIHRMNDSGQCPNRSPTIP